MPENGGVLCLHLGNKIGWSSGSSDAGVWQLPKTDDHGCLGAALIDAVADMTRVLRPSAILLSGPPTEVETTARPDVAVLHIGLLMCVRVFAFRRKIRMEVPNVEVVRETMLGRREFGRAALKDAVMGFARRRGLDKIDLDAGHALVLSAYVQQRGIG